MAERSNREWVGWGLEQLADALGPWIEERLGGWPDEAPSSGRQDPGVQLRLMWERWQSTFRAHLRQSERTLVSELWETRNRWAHNEQFTDDDCWRCL